MIHMQFTVTTMKAYFPSWGTFYTPPTNSYNRSVQCLFSSKHLYTLYII